MRSERPGGRRFAITAFKIQAVRCHGTAFSTGQWNRTQRSGKLPSGPANRQRASLVFLE